MTRHVLLMGFSHQRFDRVISRPVRLPFAMAVGCALVVLLSLPLWAGAAAPSNDVCAGAEVIPATAGATGPYLTDVTDIGEATNDGDPQEHPCQPFVDRGVWYRFTPASTAFFTLSTWSRVAPGTTVPDTVMAIYTSDGGCNGPFVPLPDSVDTFGCNDDISNPTVLQSAITTLLLADATYYILVWRYNDELPVQPGQTQVQLHVVKTSPPQNDTCNNAHELYLNIPVAGSTIGGIDDYRLGDTNGFTGVGHRLQPPPPADLRDVVYAFTAPAAGLYSFKVLNLDLQNDLVIYLVTNCPPAGSPTFVSNCLAAANRTIFGAEEIMCQNLAAQQRVFLIVDENLYAQDPYLQGGNFWVEVTPCTRETEDNGSPTNAIPFVCGIEASADPRGDVDFFALGTYPTGSRLFAFVDGGAANSTKDFDLRVTTATETLEFDDSDNGQEFGDFSPNICGLPVPREPIFLRVDSKLVFPAEPCRTYAVVQPSWVKATPEAEPNNTLSQANAAPANYYRGTLDGPDPSTDVDTFKFEAESGELIFVGLDGNPQRNNVALDAKLDLLNAQGNSLLSVNNTISTEVHSSTNRTPGSLEATQPFSPGEAFVFRVLDDGIYYVRVSVDPLASTNLASGDYLLSITKGCTGTITPNHPVTIATLDAPTLVYEGEPFTVSGSLVDPDALDTHSLIVDWGDWIETQELGPGVLTFQVTHQYPDHDPSGSPRNTYSPTIVAIDEAGAAATNSFTLTVANIPPRIETLELSTNALFEGQSVTLTGTFTDPGVRDSHQVRIAWGDGTTNTLDIGAGLRMFAATHTVQDDIPSLTPSDLHSIQVTLYDDDGGTNDASTTVTVSNAPPQLTGVSLTSPIWPSTSATLDVTLGDPSPLDTFTLIVDWGDGTVLQTNTYPAGGGTFSLTHPYVLSHTNLLVQLTLVDDDTDTTTGSANLEIKPNPAQPVLSITPLSNHNALQATSGTPGVTYRLEVSPDLTTWTVLPGSEQTADSNGIMLFEDTAPPTGTNRFYRITWP